MKFKKFTIILKIVQKQSFISLVYKKESFTFKSWQNKV